jgi:hypothetical protein
VEFPYPVAPIVRHHHEQWNGQGYPDGIAGEDIPLGARILTVVDCFDALTSDRPYRRRMTDADAIDIVRARSGSMYDPRVVDAFVDLVPALRRADAAAEGRSDRFCPAIAAPAGKRDRPAVVDPATRQPALRRVGAAVAGKLATVIPTAEMCLFAPEAGSDLLTAAYATAAIAGPMATLTVRVGEGLAGWVAANRHTIANSQAALDLGDMADALGLASCTATPVFALGGLVAVLCVYSPTARGFAEEEVRAIGALAQEIGLAMAYDTRPFALDMAPAAPLARAAAAVC